jgi:23S rRNA pseudouridine1911/1915/1917 synthase
MPPMNTEATEWVASVFIWDSARSWTAAWIESAVRPQNEESETPHPTKAESDSDSRLERPREPRRRDSSEISDSEPDCESSVDESSVDDLDELDDDEALPAISTASPRIESPPIASLAIPPSPPSSATGDPGPSRRSERVLDLTVSSDEKRLDAFLARMVPDCSREYLKRLILGGNVVVTPAPAGRLKPSVELHSGQSVRVAIPPPVEMRCEPEDIPIDIIYQDASIAVIDKPAGLSVHPSPGQSSSTLVNALLFSIRDLSGIGGVERPGIVHRLDRETSGVLVIAKNDRAHHGLAAQFKERVVQKTYHAICRGEPRALEGRIELAIGRSKTHSKKMVVRTDGSGRSALTDYTVVERFRGYSLIECRPKTGRTHQIRVHLTHLQLPIAGDKLYGREKQVSLGDLTERERSTRETPILARQALHASRLAFRHPESGAELVFEAPMPSDMQALLDALRATRRLG